MYLLRHADLLLDELFGELPAIILLGPRATGKTTTATRRAATVVRLDRRAEASAFEADPDSALSGLAEPVLLDEWQVVPGVLGAIKRAVDAEPRPGRFLVTGSVRAELTREAWPATGRLISLAMYPMTMREQLARVAGTALLDRVERGEPLVSSTPAPDLRGYVELALRSGFPHPALRLNADARAAWLRGYVTGLLTRDIEQVERPVTRRRDIERLRRYFEAYALNTAGSADHKTIFDAAGIARATAVEYEELLSGLFLVEQIPAWTSNRLKRLVLQPKRYVVDPALVATAAGVNVDGVIRDGDLLGRVLETFVVAQLRPELALAGARPRLYHLRTKEGRHEIDVVAELAGGRLIGIEVKAGAPSARDARHLVWLRDQLGERFVAGVVLHTGPRPYALGERITAAPISTLWA